MKNLWLAVCTVMLAVACDNDNNQQQTVLNGTAVSIQSAVIPPVGGEIMFAVTTDAPWKVYDKPDWLILTPAEGKAGTTSVQMSAEMNRTYQDRDCTLRIETSTGSLSETVAVSQEYPYIELSRDGVDFAWNCSETLESEAEVITLHSNVEWKLTPVMPNLVELREEAETAEENPTPGADWIQYTAALRSEADEIDWLSFSPSSGTGDAELRFCPKTYNISREPREMVIRVEGPLDTYELNFSQANLRFIVEPETLAAFDAANPEAAQVQVDAERPWTLLSAPSWIEASPAEGVDITTLTIQPDGANPTREDRSGEVVLLCEEVVERKISVAQYGYVFDVAPTSFDLENADTESHQISLTSSGAWEARNVPEWIELSAAEGAGGGVAEMLTLRATGQNLELEERQATIEFGSKQNTLSQNVQVSQAAFIFETSATQTVIPTLSTDAYELSIRCSGPWTVSSSETWLELSKSSGTGDEVITFRAKSANTDEKPRESTITVTSTLNHLTRTSKITQRGYVFTVTPQNYAYPTLPGQSNRCQVQIECSASWNISSKPDWIQATAMSGVGDASVTLSAENNTLLAERSGTVTFTSVYNGATKHLNVQVSQDKFIFEVSASSFDVPTIVSTPCVATVQCSSEWSVLNLPEWIKASPMTHTGNGSVSFNVESNPQLQSRSATVQVKSTLGGHTHDIAFTQAAFQFDSSPVTHTCEAVDASSLSFEVVCSGAWSFVGAPSWVTLSPASGTGNMQVRIGVNNNVQTSPREAEFVLRSSLNGLERPITVSQKQFEFDASPESFSYEAINSTSTPVSVVCMGGWSVQGAEAWMNVSPQSGSGNGSITIAPSTNTEKRIRSGVVRVVSTLNPQLAKEITVSQKAFEFDETAEDYSYGALNPGSTPITIDAMGAWSVENIPAWVNVSPASGSGDGRITITPQQNLETQGRSVTLYVTSSLNASLRKPITLTQEAFRFNAATEQIAFSAIDPERRTVTIECMEGWTVTNGSDWVSVSPMSGSNDGSVSITVSENLQTSPRSATVQISSTLNPALVKRIEVSQEAFRFDATPQNLSFGAIDGAEQRVPVSCMGAWSVENSTGWISVTPSSGSNDGSVNVRVEQNLETSARSGSFEIVSTKNPSLKRVVTVQQGAFEFNAETVGLDFSAVGPSEQSVTVVCMGGWSVQGAESWMNVSPQSGSGNGSIAIRPSDNAQTSPRSGVVRVVSTLNPRLEKQITVSQQAFSFDTQTEEITCEALQPAASRIEISGLGGWSVEDAPAWVEVTPSSGNGSGWITITPEENVQTDERSATLHVVSTVNPAMRKAVILTQKAYQFEVSPLEITLAADASDVGTVRITGSGGAWSLECDTPWLTLSTRSGDGAGSFTVGASSANDTGAERSAEIRVVNSLNASLNQTIRVTQLP